MPWKNGTRVRRASSMASSLPTWVPMDGLAERIDRAIGPVARPKVPDLAGDGPCVPAWLLGYGHGTSSAPDPPLHSAVNRAALEGDCDDLQDPSARRAVCGAGRRGGHDHDGVRAVATGHGR